MTDSGFLIVPSGALDVNLGDCLKLLGALLAAWATVSHSGRFRARPSQANFPGNDPCRICLLSYITSIVKNRFSHPPKATGHAGPRACDCLAGCLGLPRAALVTSLEIEGGGDAMFLIPPSGALASALGTVSIIWGLAARLGDPSIDCLTLWALPRATKPSQFPGK